MAKWNLFAKSKKNEKETVKNKDEAIKEEIGTENQETKEIKEDKPLAEHHETLETGKKRKTDKSSDQRIWRDVDSIENKIDKLHITNAEKPVSEIDKKVDRIVSKVKEKTKKKKKLPNVIYVVSDPQPGQVKGDWAVKGHHKIYSHHRKKDAAIDAARKVARERDATVMVQNTDGTFSDGFKPKKK